MKNFRMFAMAAAALVLGLTSCNKESGGAGKDAERNNVTLSLSGMNGSGSGNTRAVDDAANGVATTFASGQLAFVKGTSVTAVYTIADYSGVNDLPAGKVDIALLTGAAGVTFPNIDATKVYVIGNKTLVGLSKDANINTVLANASNQLAVADLKGGLFVNAVLFGSGNILSTLGGDGPNPLGISDAWAVVDVRPVASRIEISKVSDIATNKFDLVGIYVNNYYTNLQIVPGFNATIANTSTNLKTWLHSEIAPANYPGTTSTFHEMINQAAVNSAAPAVGKVWAFNVFPAINAAAGDDNLPHILLHFKNLTDNAGASLGRNTDVYITIGKYNNLTDNAFKAGYVYTIADLKWDVAKNGGGQWEIDLIDCDLKMNIIKWTAEALDPQIN